MTGGVVRRWEADIARGEVAAWEDAYRARVLDKMRGIAGFRGIRVMLSTQGNPCRMTVLTYWDDMDAVRSFAGDDPARTVLPDFMSRFFPRYDAEATFHEMAMEEMT